MTRLVWDQIGAHKFETGCDRGVLYLPDGSAVPWNGLTGVDEDASASAVSEYYLDGIKYLNDRALGDFSATLKAFTYPDEFMPFDGLGEMAPGLIATNQPVTQQFGLSYRTLLGNDVKGVDYGYRIHVMYNLTAEPADKSYSTNGETPAGMELSWIIRGIPIFAGAFWPTSHIIIDSTRITPAALVLIENALYGTSIVAATLPDPATLYALQQSVS